MSWTQKKLEELYQEINRRLAEDPEFAEKLRKERENGKTEGAVLSTADMDSPGITRGPVSGEDTLRTDAESGSSSAEVRRVNINTASVYCHWFNSLFFKCS